MSRGSLRRAAVFIDYSALRDNLRKWITGDQAARFDPSWAIDYEKLGRLLCGQDLEFVRTNLYTAVPVAVEERDGGAWAGSIDLHEHEAYKARSVMRSFARLQEHVDTRCRFTRLVTGRMIVRRVELRHGPAFEWAQQILAAVGGGTLAPEDKEPFDRAARVNSEAREARDRLSRRILELREQGRIPGPLMSAYNWRMAELLDEQLDFTEKGVDTRLTVEMLEQCMADAYDAAVIFAADEDYIPLVEAVKRTGRVVRHAFWDMPNPGWALRKVCDEYVAVGRDDLESVLMGE